MQFFVSNLERIWKIIVSLPQVDEKNCVLLGKEIAFFFFNMFYSDYLKLLKIFVVGVFPCTLFVNAPHGKLAKQSKLFSKGYISGRVGWVLMELVAPLTFLYAIRNNRHFESTLPSLGDGSNRDYLDSCRKVLAGMFLVHYANRALVSPLLMAPQVSPMHWTVFVSAVLFNFLNGMSIGLYLVQASVQHHPVSIIRRYIGMFLWLMGWLGNMYHDNILYDLRRSSNKKKDPDNLDTVQSENSYYRIPYGGLFQYVSCPNYFCEWIEWFGCYLAAGPSAEPFWWFFLSEILLMLPRALKAHQWYCKKFPKYPANRRAIIPFLM